MIVDVCEAGGRLWRGRADGADVGQEHVGGDVVDAWWHGGSSGCGKLLGCSVSLCRSCTCRLEFVPSIPSTYPCPLSDSFPYDHSTLGIAFRESAFFRSCS